jgi:hypothetical protein
MVSYANGSSRMRPPERNPRSSDRWSRHIGARIIIVLSLGLWALIFYAFHIWPFNT